MDRQSKRTYDKFSKLVTFAKFLTSLF